LPIPEHACDCLCCGVQVSTALVALALVQLIQLLSMLQVCVQVAAETENLMAGAERMLDYTHLPQEEPNRWVPTVIAIILQGVMVDEQRYTQLLSCFCTAAACTTETAV
jgi:hypothetical protein